MSEQLRDATVGDLAVSGSAVGRSGEPERRVADLSFSQLEDYDSCGERYRLKRVARVPQLQLGAGLGGKAVHKAIELGEKGKWWEKPDSVARALLLGAFAEAFSSAISETSGEIIWGKRQHVWRDASGKELRDQHGKAVKTGENERWWREQGAPMFLDRFVLLRRQDAKRGWNVLDASVEVNIRAKLDEHHTVQGYIDAALYVDENGELVPRDYKTGTFIKEKQLWIYGWLLRETRELPVSRAQFAYLRGAKPESWIKEYQIAELVDLVPRLFADHVRGIELGLFPFNPSSLCSSCVVRPHCEIGKHLEVEDGSS